MRRIDADHLKETIDYYIREAGWGEEINMALGWVKDEFIDSEPTVESSFEIEAKPKDIQKMQLADRWHWLRWINYLQI